MRKSKPVPIRTFLDKYGLDKAKVKTFRQMIVESCQLTAKDLDGWDKIIEREWGRIIVTGTMDSTRQMARPAREIGLGIQFSKHGSSGTSPAKSTSTKPNH